MLWIAYNGHRGSAWTGVLVEADDEESARRLASLALREEALGSTWLVRQRKVEQYAEIAEIRPVDLPVVGEFDLP